MWLIGRSWRQKSKTKFILIKIEENNSLIIISFLALKINQNEVKQSETHVIFFVVRNRQLKYLPIDINQIKQLIIIIHKQMESQEQQEKKQFSVPSRDQLIQQIKDLDQTIEHVALNLIKCDFNATEKDIQKAFPDFKFIKIKNYNPGSFEVVFQMRIDAINFIKNHYDKKILNRRFFIKMGRQQKQLIEKWTGVGSAPRNFRAPNRPNNNKNPPFPNKKSQEHKTQKKKQAETPTQQTKTQTKETQTKTEAKKQIHSQEVSKKQGKIIPKTDIYHKKPEIKKPIHHEAEKKTEEVVKKDEPHHAVKKEQTHPVVKKEQHHVVAKKPEVQGAKKEGEKKDGAKKDEKKESELKGEQKEKKKEEDDEWIVVPSGKGSKRR